MYTGKVAIITPTLPSNPDSDFVYDYLAQNAYQGLGSETIIPW